MGGASPTSIVPGATVKRDGHVLFGGNSDLPFNMGVCVIVCVACSKCVAQNETLCRN